MKKKESGEAAKLRALEVKVTCSKEERGSNTGKGRNSEDLASKRWSDNSTVGAVSNTRQCAEVTTATVGGVSSLAELHMS